MTFQSLISSYYVLFNSWNWCKILHDLNWHLSSNFVILFLHVWQGEVKKGFWFIMMTALSLIGKLFSRAKFLVCQQFSQTITLITEPDSIKFQIFKIYMIFQGEILWTCEFKSLYIITIPTWKTCQIIDVWHIKHWQ